MERNKGIYATFFFFWCLLSVGGLDSPREELHLRTTRLKPPNRKSLIVAVLTAEKRDDDFISSVVRKVNIELPLPDNYKLDYIVSVKLILKRSFRLKSVF